ncbi:MAG: SDR family oxidoreductase [Acetobacteraceae bacterium]|nr:SDR family oxidoreductase [Acetobacteraceae bacterium]
MYDLDGRTALVTGGGAGIGRAIALRLAAEGCDIGILDLDLAGAEATAAEARALGRAAHAASGNVGERASAEAAVAALSAALGRVDILVNNAGILRTSPFLETTDAEWRGTFAVNLDGAFHCCQAVLPGMVARRAGAVVNVASWTGKKGVPNHAAYSASKFALIGLTQAIAGEMAAHGIRVNAVCPGIIVETRMREEAEERNRAQGLPDVATRLASIPLRRAGYPEDVANLVAFLASDQAAYMTGQAVNVTGGLWMG